MLAFHVESDWFRVGCLGDSNALPGLGRQELEIEHLADENIGSFRQFRDVLARTAVAGKDHRTARRIESICKAEVAVLRNGARPEMREMRVLNGGHLHGAIIEDHSGLFDRSHREHLLRQFHRPRTERVGIPRRDAQELHRTLEES